MDTATHTHTEANVNGIIAFLDIQLCIKISECVFVCVCSPDLSRSQTKVLECLEFIPQHGEPVTTANYDNIRRYLIKVQVAVCETLSVSVFIIIFALICNIYDIYTYINCI